MVDAHTEVAAEERAAERLRIAAATGVPTEPVRDLIGPRGIEAAYRVQARNIELALAGGAQVVGRKIGLTSDAVQRQVGVKEPDFGTLLDSMWFEEGRPIPLTAILQPRIEAEIALVLGRDINRQRPTAADVVRAIGFVVPCFEIVGSRIVDWDITIADTIADNASSGGFVLGGPFRRIDGIDLANVTMSMRRDDVEVSRGTGRACLGHPLNAAVWLARRLATLGIPLRDGDVVLTGSLGPLVSITGASDFVADFGDLGVVSVAFDNGS